MFLFRKKVIPSLQALVADEKIEANVRLTANVVLQKLEAISTPDAIGLTEVINDELKNIDTDDDDAFDAAEAAEAAANAADRATIVKAMQSCSAFIERLKIPRPIIGLKARFKGETAPPLSSEAIQLNDIIDAATKELKRHIEETSLDRMKLGRLATTLYLLQDKLERGILTAEQAYDQYALLNQRADARHSLQIKSEKLTFAAGFLIAAANEKMEMELNLSFPTCNRMLIVEWNATNALTSLSGKLLSTIKLLALVFTYRPEHAGPHCTASKKILEPMAADLKFAVDRAIHEQVAAKKLSVNKQTPAHQENDEELNWEILTANIPNAFEQAMRELPPNLPLLRIKPTIIQNTIAILCRRAYLKDLTAPVVGAAAVSDAETKRVAVITAALAPTVAATVLQIDKSGMRAAAHPGPALAPAAAPPTPRLAIALEKSRSGNFASQAGPVSPPLRRAVYPWYEETYGRETIDMMSEFDAVYPAPSQKTEIALAILLAKVRRDGYGESTILSAITRVILKKAEIAAVLHESHNAREASPAAPAPSDAPLEGMLWSINRNRHCL